MNRHLTIKTQHTLLKYKKAIKYFITALALFLFWTCAAHALQTLPALNNISRIEISGPVLNIINITDAKKINQITSFINQYQSSWAIAKKPKIKPSLVFSFYSSQQHITDIDISTQAISQLYGKYWSQPIEKNIMKKFAGSTHPAIEENLFPIIPVDEDSQRKYKNWRAKIKNLEEGIHYREIKSFTLENNIRIKEINTSNDNYWLSLELLLINDGNYVDTIIGAKIFLNKNQRLKHAHFLGYQLSKKNRPRKN